MAVTADHVPLLGSERRAPKDARLLGPASPGQRVSVTIGVRRHPGAPALPDLAALGAQRPRDRARPVDRAELAKTLGADPADLARVEEFARGHGLSVESSRPEGRGVQVSGTVEQLGRAFGVQLQTYAYPGGTYRGREGHVYVPRELAGVVERVSGLTDRPLARPHAQAQPRNLASIPTSQIAQLYDFPTVSDGTGVTIGIIELGGGYSQSDLDTYFSSQGLATPTVVPVSVLGAGNNYGDPADGEVELDIEVAGTVAPGAKIAVYFAPNSEQGFIEALYTAIFDTANSPSVISISWGAPEEWWTAVGRTGMDGAFLTAAVAGITVLAAAGDNGSNDNVYDGQAHCDFPASDPYVIACGGTTLDVGDTGKLLGEVVWNNGFGWATGGGISGAFPLPWWQASAGVGTSVNDGYTIGRGVPDVAGDADPATGYPVVTDGQWMTFGGTSAVSPLYAGLFALVISSVGFPLGFITPYLYELSGTDVFVDVVSGTNAVLPAPGYDAGKGWDACSGLGRINGTALLDYV